MQSMAISTVQKRSVTNQKRLWKTAWKMWTADMFNFYKQNPITEPLKTFRFLPSVGQVFNQASSWTCPWLGNFCCSWTTSPIVWWSDACSRRREDCLFALYLESYGSGCGYFPDGRCGNWRHQELHLVLSKPTLCLCSVRRSRTTLWCGFDSWLGLLEAFPTTFRQWGWLQRKFLLQSPFFIRSWSLASRWLWPSLLIWRRYWNRYLQEPISKLMRKDCRGNCYRGWLRP